MKIYFDNPEYDGQFLRAVDHAPLSAQIGEAWTKKKRSTPNAQRPMSEIRGQRSMPSRVIGEQQSVNKEENVQPCSAKPATQGEEERPTPKVFASRRRASNKRRRSIPGILAHRYAQTVMQSR